jgi:hypothetical protein
MALARITIMVETPNGATLKASTDVQYGEWATNTPMRSMFFAQQLRTLGRSLAEKWDILVAGLVAKEVTSPAQNRQIQSFRNLRP